MNTTTFGDYSSESTPAGSGKDINLPAYFTVVALSIWMWDVLSCSRRDLRVLLALRGRKFQNHTYVLSKLATVTYLVAQIVFQTAPAGNCAVEQKAISSLYILSVLFTLLLLYFRLRAIFLVDRYISVLFGLLWICSAGSCVTLFPGISTLSIAANKHCALSPSIEPYVSAFLIGPLLYTSLVFMFIAARLVESCEIDFMAKNGFGEFIVKDCKSVLSRGFLQEGQKYYLITVLSQLISLVLFLLGPSTLRIVLQSLNLAIMHMAACRVHVAYQEKILKEEQDRRAKIMFSLTGNEALAPIAVDLGGIRVTKTVEQFTV